MVLDYKVKVFDSEHGNERHAILLVYPWLYNYYINSQEH